MGSFLNQLESDRVTKLCSAADSDERLFWKLLKGQKSSSQISAFLVNGSLITDINEIRNMWADHFEALGSPSESATYDNGFAALVSAHVKETVEACLDDPGVFLTSHFTYDEIVNVCSKLKPGVCGVLLDYEHIRYAGPPLWNLLFILYQDCFCQFSVPKNIKKGIILPLFKGKGAKANNKNSYCGITLFPTLCKIYEMVLLNRLEKFAADRGYFSELQFGFWFCIEASFTILETINHMLERGSKVFSCFLDVRKAFDTVWIDGLLYKLFNDLGIKGRMWLAIKDLYTDVKAQVLYSGELSREFDVSQGTGQGRIFAPFMYKVYNNSLLQKLSNHCYAISIYSLSLPAPSFADDVTLLALFPSFLKTFLNICHQYSVTWRYEFNHTKSGVVTFGETKPIHSRLMKERECTLGDTKVDELYEYKNIGVLKNYAGSFTSNILDNIEKTRKKAGMIFSSDFDRRKTKPLIYIKFWKQACLPCLLFGAELFSLNKSQLCQLERCQQRFLKNVFYVPKFAPGLLLLKISNLNSVESEIDLKKLLFLGRLITEPNMSAVVKGLFRSRASSFFEADFTPIGVLPSICEAFNKYDLFHYFQSWFLDSLFPSYSHWK